MILIANEVCCPSTNEPMRRRRITPEQVQEREHILHEINAQPPLSQLLRSFQTTEGFHALFCRIQHLYPNNIEAYEALEDEYIRIFGERRFSEYDSFRGSVGSLKR